MGGDSEHADFVGGTFRAILGWARHWVSIGSEGRRSEWTTTGCKRCWDGCGSGGESDLVVEMPAVASMLMS